MLGSGGEGLAVKPALLGGASHGPAQGGTGCHQHRQHRRLGARSIQLTARCGLPGPYVVQPDHTLPFLHLPASTRREHCQITHEQARPMSKPLTKGGNQHRVTSEAEAAEQRVQKARWLAKLFDDPSSLASQTAAAYSELLEEAILDVRCCTSALPLHLRGPSGASARAAARCCCRCSNSLCCAVFWMSVCAHAAIVSSGLAL